MPRTIASARNVCVCFACDGTVVAYNICKSLRKERNEEYESILVVTREKPTHNDPYPKKNLLHTVCFSSCIKEK